MKLSVTIGALVSVVLITGAANAAKVKFAADANGRNEVNDPVDVADLDEVKGGAVLVFDDQTKILCGRLQYDDPTKGYGTITGPATGLHIHQAPKDKPNDDGPAEQKIIIPVKPKEVTFKAMIPDAWATSLMAGEIYMNIHTAKNTTGEARGTLDPFVTDFECDPNAPMLQIGTPAADAGAGDGGSTTSSTSSSGGADTSSSSSSSSSSGDEKPSSNGGLEKPEEEKPAADSGGCSTSSSTPENLLGLTLLGGLAAAVIARAKKKKK
jgi:hypothetical protein